MKRRVAALVSVCLSLSFLVCAQDPDPSLALRKAKVYKILDGDTVRLKGGKTVRYLGIDTPEIGEPFADVAKRLNRELVLYKTVWLEFDENERDQYGRLLAFVYVETDDGWVMVNLELLRAGLARLLFIVPNSRYRDHFEEALHEAMVARRGLWGKFPGVLPLSQVEAESVKYVTEVVTVRFFIYEIEETDKEVLLHAADSRFSFHVIIPSASLDAFAAAGIDPRADYVGEWVEVTGTLECRDVRKGLSVTLEFPDQIIIGEG